MNLNGNKILNGFLNIWLIKNVSMSIIFNLIKGVFFVTFWFSVFGFYFILNL